MTRLRVTLLFWLENMMYMTDNIPAISLRKFIRSRKLKVSLSAFVRTEENNEKIIVKWFEICATYKEALSQLKK